MQKTVEQVIEFVSPTYGIRAFVRVNKFSTQINLAEVNVMGSYNSTWDELTPEQADDVLTEGMRIIQRHLAQRRKEEQDYLSTE